MYALYNYLYTPTWFNCTKRSLNKFSTVRHGVLGASATVTPLYITLLYTRDAWAARKAVLGNFLEFSSRQNHICSTVLHITLPIRPQNVESLTFSRIIIIIKTKKTRANSLTTRILFETIVNQLRVSRVYKYINKYFRCRNNSLRSEFYRC